MDAQIRAPPRTDRQVLQILGPSNDGAVAYRTPGVMAVTSWVRLAGKATSIPAVPASDQHRSREDEPTAAWNRSRPPPWASSSETPVASLGQQSFRKAMTVTRRRLPRASRTSL